MTKNLRSADLPWLIKTYFSDPDRTVRLEPGQTLMEQWGSNERLFLIKRGRVEAQVDRPGGGRYPLFQAQANMFVGVYSYFSKTYRSLAAVIVLEEGEAAYIDKDQAMVPDGGSRSLFEQFMPIVVADLALRQQHEQEIALEKERMLTKLIQSEKLASLGQMAAGIAHELNNAVAVLGRNTAWLGRQLKELMEGASPDDLEFFETGIQSGHGLSSREIRARTAELKRWLALPGNAAAQLAETGIPLDRFLRIRALTLERAERIHHAWAIGASLHDMTNAARLATDVVRSTKSLAVPSALRQQQDIRIGESIRKALALLGSPLRRVNVVLELEESLPTIRAGRSELVQIWSNLIRNAIESMAAGQTPDPTLTIRGHEEKEYIVVEITDNGPGIPPEIRERIFQPDFTTKGKGLTFGLGLGLPIVERIVSAYNGGVAVRSRPGETVFTVTLPLGEQHE